MPTDIGIDQQRRFEEGRSARGLGEQAAIEALERFPATDAQAEALLLEDSDVSKRRAIMDERISLISTGDFLRGLESAGLIQSADHILDRAADCGRNIHRQPTAALGEGSGHRLASQLRQRHHRI